MYVYIYITDYYCIYNMYMFSIDNIKLRFIILESLGNSDFQASYGTIFKAHHGHRTVYSDHPMPSTSSPYSRTVI